MGSAGWTDQSVFLLVLDRPRIERLVQHISRCHRKSTLQRIFSEKFSVLRCGMS
jgi:hypothetical protein